MSCFELYSPLIDLENVYFIYRFVWYLEENMHGLDSSEIYRARPLITLYWYNTALKYMRRTVCHTVSKKTYKEHVLVTIRGVYQLFPRAHAWVTFLVIVLAVCSCALHAAMSLLMISLRTNRRRCATVVGGVLSR